MERTVVVIDPLTGGHHLSYMEWLCVLLLRQGLQVVALTPDPAVLSRRIAVAGADHQGRFGAREYSGDSGPVTGELAAARRWMQAARQVRGIWRERGGAPPRVLFAWVDAYVYTRVPPMVVDLLFPFPWTGIYFHPRTFRVVGAGAGRRRRAVSVFRARRCRGVGVLDAGIMDALSLACNGKPVVHIPDMADDTPPDPDYSVANALRAFARGRTVVTLVGSLAPRKGVRNFLRVARLMDPEKWCFALVGEPVATQFGDAEQSRLRQACAEMADRLFCHLERIPGEAQFNAVVAASQVLFAVYEQFPHSSNMLAKGALFRKPLVVAEGYFMGELVRRHALGEVVPAGDADACSAALERLAGRLAAPAAFGFDGYRAAHSAGAFEDAVRRLVGAA